MKISKDKKDLIIKVPLKAVSSNPYDEYEEEYDNIIGIIEPDPQSSEPKLGFCYQINMSYKNKPNQWTDYFLIYTQGDKKDFIKLCEELGIDWFEYEACVKCGKCIYGTCTWDNGSVCWDCDKKSS